MIARFLIYNLIEIGGFLMVSIITQPAWTLEESLKCVNIDYYGKNYTPKVKPCVKNKICNKTFSISYINMPPYNFEDKDGLGLVELILQQCCGPCINTTIHTFNNLSEISVTSLQNYHFIFPILGPSSATDLHGFHFLPYGKLSKVVYVTKSKTESLLDSVLHICPLIVVCIALSVVSGFIAWILETWTNREEFPRSFVNGWFEGFWWSFISMTTVGYGDKTPRTVPARLYSIVWILIGIVAFGVLTSELTGHIVKMNSPPPPSMKGKTVGVLNYRDYDAYVKSENGGMIRQYETHEEDFPNLSNATDLTITREFLTLLWELESENIDGFVIDPWTLELATEALADLESISVEPELIDFFFAHSTRVEILNKGTELSYGILIRHREDYDYIRRYVEGNRVSISIYTSQTWMATKRYEEAAGYGKYHSSASSDLFSASGTYFKYSMIAIAGMIVMIVILGTFYELNRRSYVRSDVCRCALK